MIRPGLLVALGDDLAAASRLLVRPDQTLGGVMRLGWKRMASANTGLRYAQTATLNSWRFPWPRGSSSGLASSTSAEITCGEPVLWWDGNGHYYKSCVISPGTWYTYGELDLLARQSGHAGQMGHLLTITSQAEFDFVKFNVGLAGYVAAQGDQLQTAGSYQWLVTGPETSDAYVRVTAHEAAGNAVSDLSDAPFMIAAPTPALLRSWGKVKTIYR